MSGIALLKPEQAAKRARAKVAEFKKEEARKALEAKRRPAPDVEKPAEDISKKTKKELNDKLVHVSVLGEIDAVQRLLKAGADAKAGYSDGFTALMAAAHNGHTELVQVLIKAGADVAANDDRGETALDLATKGKRAEIVEILKKQLNELLLEMASTGHEKEVKRILNAGADANARNKDGWTALMYSARDGHTEVAGLLIEKGADVDAKSNDGWTTLKLASRNGHMGIVEFLRANGAK